MPRTSHKISDGIVSIEYVAPIAAEQIIGPREEFLADPRFVPGMSFLCNF